MQAYPLTHTRSESECGKERRRKGRWGGGEKLRKSQEHLKTVLTFLLSFCVCLQGMVTAPADRNTDSDERRRHQEHFPPIGGRIQPPYQQPRL